MTAVFPLKGDLADRNHLADAINQLNTRTTVFDSWTTPTFANSWVNYDAGTNAQAGYWKDFLGIVHLKGLVKDGSAVPTSVFTLPAGYRPLGHESFAVASSAGYGRIDVLSTGVVNIAVGSTTWTSLSGITFRTS